MRFTSGKMPPWPSFVSLLKPKNTFSDKTWPLFSPLQEPKNRLKGAHKTAKKQLNYELNASLGGERFVCSLLKPKNTFSDKT